MYNILNMAQAITTIYILGSASRPMDLVRTHPIRTQQGLGHALAMPTELFDDITLRTLVTWHRVPSMGQFKM